MTSSPLSPAVTAVLDETGMHDAALAVVTRDDTWLSGNHGRPAWASVTKVVTAVAVLAAASRNVDDLLDEPLGPPGSTVRHLLSHASGLGLETEAEVLARPGKRRIYSNVGFELVADIVRTRSGGDFGAVVGRQVFAPLRMVNSVLRGSPAHGVHGSVEDLARLAEELLQPRVLDRQIIELVSTPVYAELSGILPGFGRQTPNLWGLGCEVRGDKSPHWTAPSNSPRTFGHFGRSGSFLWVDPSAGVAAAFLGDRPFGDWATEGWPRLNEAILGAYGA